MLCNDLTLTKLEYYTKIIVFHDIFQLELTTVVNFMSRTLFIREIKYGGIMRNISRNSIL